MYSTIFAAVSTDGYIAGNDNQHNWVSADDSIFLAGKLKDYPVLVMGRKTFEANISKLTAPGKTRIVLTTRPAFFAKKYPNIAQFTNKSLQQILSQYANQNIAILGGTQIYTTALQQGLCSDVYITQEPVVLGTGVLFTNPPNILFNLYSQHPKADIPKRVQYYIKRPN